MKICLKFSSFRFNLLNYLGSLFFVFFFFALSISRVFAASATMQFSPASGSFTIGQNFTVNVLLNTGGGRSSGTDMIVSFPADKIILTDITPGTIYNQYVGKDINNSRGLASISGIASSTSSLFSGNSTFATLSFKAIDTGTANLSFNFTKGNKNDTNVSDFDAQDDILTSVTNATFTISGPTGVVITTTSNTQGGNTTTSTTTSTSNSTVRASSLPVTASSSTTIFLTIISLVFMSLGAIFTKLSF